VKKILCAVLALAMVFMCGCSAFLEKEYLSISDYDSGVDEPAEPEISAIESYAGLRAALQNMVQQHQESAQLQFSNYAGNISDDLAEASWQVKSASALGAYMVDYISYDINRIVTYYQATVYINYTRSAEEMEKIHSIGANKIAETVVGAVAAGEGSVAMQVYTSSIDGSAMARRVEEALLNAPADIPVMPDISVDVYSGSDLRRIFEVKFDYREPEKDIALMRAELQDAIRAAGARIRPDEDYSIAILAADVLGDICRYNAGDDTGTAYDALLGGSGGSRAVSMAYAAVCAARGLETKLVSGLKNNENYCWAMVKVDGFWYHADAVEAIGLPAETPFLRNDSEMVRTFRWDEMDYPSCDGPSFLPVAEKNEQISQEN
jgi:hypothetical protein